MNDIRYRVRCSQLIWSEKDKTYHQCTEKLGDFALSLEPEQRKCFQHKKFDLKKEVKPFIKNYETD